MRGFLLVFLVACSAPAKPPLRDPDPMPSNHGVAKDTRTPIEIRRDAACSSSGDKLVSCAVADADTDLASGKVSKAEHDKNTAPEIRRGLKAEWLKTCTRPLTSHQVRVLEVCLKEEAACGPFADCLQHLNDELKK